MQFEKGFEGDLRLYIVDTSVCAHLQDLQVCFFQSNSKTMSFITVKACSQPKVAQQKSSFFPPNYLVVEAW